MLVSRTTGPEQFIVPGNIWHGSSSPKSSSRKIAEHNDFLTLLSPRQPTKKSVDSAMSTAVASAATVLGDGVFAFPNVKHNKNGTTYFGSKPRDASQTQPRVSAKTTKIKERGNSDEEKRDNDSPLNIIQSAHNMDIDLLSDILYKHAVIKDLAVPEARNISIPKGYAMDGEIKPADIYNMRQGIKSDLKRKRQEGVRVKSSESKHPGGFRPHEVNNCGAVSLKGCKASSLDIDIHPLLARARFDDTPDAVYDQLAPALRLATMFLTQPSCMQFWITVALGERVDDDEMTSKFAKNCQRIRNHVELTEENAARIIKHLKDVGESDIIHFAFKHKLRTGTADVWANSGPICDYLGVKRAPGLKGTLTRSIIQLHADYYVVAKKLSQLKYPEVSQQLRFCFLFANLMMHELAHSIEGAYIRMRHEQWAEFQRSRTYTEPFWLDWQRPPECGKAWEHTMFGGEIHPINNRVDGSHGIGTSDWPPRGTSDHPDRRTWYTLPMKYIEGLFQKSTWQKKYALDDTSAFHIPRTGATSLYMNFFTTMPLSSLAKTVYGDTDLMEIVTEEPPSKLRKKATGAKEAHRPTPEEVAPQTLPTEKSHPPKFQNTKSLLSVMSGPLPTSREAAPTDKIKPFTVQELHWFKEKLASQQTDLESSNVVVEN
ncbi:uncharacterized protein KY384_009205 [Bacidia gigantensis]|uniref:uncharacterized protein n=1 Tax=Bacidia gigantensis TaxID=2732470 RepID=UPI001D03C6A7|nr:uncharacterized protein KY384_009205 [Bacidia gigantensis]KAG8525561.1 hypothetical protein KY384_009205 [Bacidia gigantensis]